MRSTHGHDDGQSNGYRSHKFFLREKALLSTLINNDLNTILDIACGSGLMLSHYINNTDFDILGVDYNENACTGAQLNELTIFRGDAFHLPLKKNSIPQIINCQFLNQQTPENASIFIEEIARILKPGGQAIIFWRNSRSLLHTMAHYLLSIVDKLKKRPLFPQYSHSIKTLSDHSKNYNLTPSFQAVSIPYGPIKYVSTKNPLAYIFGASNILVVKKL